MDIAYLLDLSLAPAPPVVHPAGAGLFPAGATPAGYGAPPSAFVPNNAPLPALRTGFRQPGRAIDPKTKDYIMQSDGRLQGLGQVPQLVQLALTTDFGSSCVADLGNAIAKIQEKGAGFRQQCMAAVGAALAPLVNQNLVQVKGVSVQDYPSNPDAGVVTVSWKDLTTGLEYKTPLGQ